MTTMTSYPQGFAVIQHPHDVELGRAVIWHAHDERIGAALNIPLPITDSSSGRFHAALSPWLFRDAAGALEARLDSETTLTVPTKALRQ
jgi:hypothetical protein